MGSVVAEQGLGDLKIVTSRQPLDFQDELEADTSSSHSEERKSCAVEAETQEQVTERVLHGSVTRPMQHFGEPRYLIRNPNDDKEVQGWISPNDVVQGALGDCYLLSALSVLAAKPNRLVGDNNSFASLCVNDPPGSSVPQPRAQCCRSLCSAPVERWTVAMCHCRRCFARNRQHLPASLRAESTQLICVVAINSREGIREVPPSLREYQGAPCCLWFAVCFGLTPHCRVGE